MSSRVPWDPSAPTPFDGRAWPDRLDARVVEGTRIHGYDAVRDLSRHYRFSDTILLALTGELPSDAAARAFEIALICLAPISVAEAPSHAGVLARVCEGAPSAVIGASAIALAEQARFTVAAWLAAIETPVEAQGDGDVAGIREALAGFALPVPLLDRATTRIDAALAILHACGLVRSDQLESAWVIARLPVVAAEAFATPAGRFREYPLNVPPFQYSEEDP